MSMTTLQGIFFLLLVPVGWFLGPWVIRLQAWASGKSGSPDWIRTHLAISRVGLVVFLAFGVVFLIRGCSGG
jgi:hypothetical protein